MMKKWNPRFLNYCRVSGGLDPDATIVRDKEEYPGGCMCGFTIWIQRKWQQWLKLKGYCFDFPCSDRDHEEFDRWLDKQKE